MYQRLRSLHLATALFSLAFLLAYAASAVELAHRKWFPHPTQTTTESLRFQPGIQDARILARTWRGELTRIETPPRGLKFRVNTPLGRTYDIDYAIATGETTVQTTTVPFQTALAFLHISRGPWAGAAMGVSVAIFLLGLTGLYLWFKNHKERLTGAILLTLGAGIALALIVSMRQG